MIQLAFICKRDMSLHRMYASAFASVMRACALAALTLHAGHAPGQDLVQVFDMAQAHDAALQAAQAQARAAGPHAAQARAALRPSVTANAAATQSRYDPAPSDVDPAGTRVNSRASSVTLNLRQPLYNRAARVDVELADAALELATVDMEITKQEFILKVAQTYLDVLSAQELLATRRQNKTSLGEQLLWVRSRVRSGLGIITDQQDAQARFDLADADVLTAENELRVRRLALDRLAGRPGIVPKLLAVQAGVLPVSVGELGNWQREATQHPAVRRAQLGLDRARLDTRRAQAGHSPTLDLVGALAANRSGGSAVPTSRAMTSSIGVEANVPLFTGYSQQNKVAEALLLEEQARHNLQATVQATTEATERAYFELRSSLAQVRALETAETSSRQSLEGTQVGNRAGVRVNLDVLNAQAQLFQTRSELAKTRYEVLMRSLRLHAAAGCLRPESLLGVNRLLAQ